MLIPAIIGRKCNQLDRTILELPGHLGGLVMGNPCLEESREYASSFKVSAPLPEYSLVKSAQQAVRSERLLELEERDGTPEDQASIRSGDGKRIIGVAYSASYPRFGL